MGDVGPVIGVGGGVEGSPRLAAQAVAAEQLARHIPLAAALTVSESPAVSVADLVT